MKKRAYRNEIAKKALEVTAAGALGGGPRFLFTPEKIKHMRANYIGSGEFDLLNNGFQFGRLLVNTKDFQILKNHFKTHVHQVPNPETDIFSYITSGTITLKNIESQDYAILFENYRYMTAPSRTVDELRKRSFDNAHLGKAIFGFNPDSELARVFREEAYRTRFNSASRNKSKKKIAKKK